MTTLTLWTDGFDMATIKGHIELTKYNSKTNDFELKLTKSKLKLIDPTSLTFVDQTNDWSWLKDIPIAEININNLAITPVWKPNKYGEPSDINEFQTVNFEDDTITISVTANGTEQEVFERYNPYLKRGTNERQNLTYNHLNLTKQEYDDRKKEDPIKIPEDLLLNLFE